MARTLELHAADTGLCMIDIQERLAAVMADKVLKGTLRNCLNLIEAARVLQLPTAVSEQYPKGLGPTLPVVAESVLRLPRDQVLFFDKLQFGCAGVKDFDEWARRSKRKAWLLAGMETHICVFQTARSLIDAGYHVHVVRDAVISRTMANWEIGLSLMERAGAVITSTEVVVFDMLKRAGTEDFKLLSHIVK